MLFLYQIFKNRQVLGALRPPLPQLPLTFDVGDVKLHD